MKNQPLKPWIKGNESITPNNFFFKCIAQFRIWSLDFFGYCSGIV